jgi:hypothetical protein
MGSIGRESTIMHHAIATLVEDTRYFAYRNDNVIPAVNSCAACGAHGPRGGMHITRNAGVHTWIEPSNELRLRRMKARQATPGFEYHSS